MKIISVANNLNWRVEEQKEGNKNLTLVCYRKYLDEALIVANDSNNSINLYYEMLKAFKVLVSPKIELTSTGEYTLKYNNTNSWYHRDKNRVIQSFYEFTLKRVCLKDGVDYMESMKRVFAMKLEDIFKK